ncbi:DNA topoisomerase 1 [Umbelopsis nana]
MASSSSDDEMPLVKRKKQIKNDSNGVRPRSAEETPDPTQARSKSVIDDGDSSDEEMPLAKRASTKPNGKVSMKREVSSDDDVPLAKKVKIEKKPTKKRPAPKDESSSEDEKPLAKVKKDIKKVPKVKAEDEAKVVRKQTKKVKDEEAEAQFKWWEQGNEDDDDSTKWTELEHNGVLFPPAYEPHGVKMKYDGKPVDLTPEAEEVAGFFAALIETDHGKNPVFQKNFFSDWQEILKKDSRNPKITSFEKCDFRPMFEYFEQEKERKKQLTKAEKQKIKDEKAVIEEPYLYAIVDGRKEKVGNFRIEPPGLFRGRGDHPKTGRLKHRVMPEQVTLNLGENAPIPKPLPGHKWGGVVHIHEATWLASWKENINGSIKYVFLAATSSWKGQSDMQKFEKARELKKHVHRIRKDYRQQLNDKLMETRQRATAMYLIDVLALRAGNEKGDDEADTVGCCSLRYEHVTLEPPNTLSFDFLGKDSIRYYNSVLVDPQVFKNIKIFKKQVGPENMIFDRLTTMSLNKHLGSYMKGLTAKVFRTYNASHTFQEQLDKLTRAGDSVHDKLLSYNRANREVAILCNHQRSVAKNHGQMIAKIQDKIRALKYQRKRARRQIIQLDKKMKDSNLPEMAEESDLEDEWIEQHQKDLLVKEREKITSKFEKNNEKLVSDGQTALPEKELKEKLKAVDEMEKEMSREKKTGKIELKANATVDKLLAQITKLDERIKATKTQALDKEEGKETALGTSKLNYIDPRISAVWCKKYNVPVEKVFSKTLRDKFQWAMEIDEDWKF